jgi:pimeloyl-ACP methyl ester carboxylesterase
MKIITFFCLLVGLCYSQVGYAQKDTIKTILFVQAYDLNDNLLPITYDKLGPDQVPSLSTTLDTVIIEFTIPTWVASSYFKANELYLGNYNCAAFDEDPTDPETPCGDICTLTSAAMPTIVGDNIITQEMIVKKYTDTEGTEYSTIAFRAKVLTESNFSYSIAWGRKVNEACIPSPQVYAYSSKKITMNLRPKKLDIINIYLQPIAGSSSKTLETRTLTSPSTTTLTTAQNGAKIATDGSTGTVLLYAFQYFIAGDNLGNINFRIKSPRNTALDGQILGFTNNTTFVYCTYQHPTYIDGDKDFIDFEIVKDNDRVIHVFRLYLTPPPILLLHGLGGSASTWASFRNLLLTQGKYTTDMIRNPTFPPCNPFDPTYQAVDTEINALIASAVSKKISAQKVDIAGHSMGGIWARYHLNNKGTTKVNRLITCNTPHWGSGMADFIEPVTIRGTQTAKKALTGCTQMVTGALIDLKLNSPAIQRLYSEQVNNKVPSHAIFTTWSGTPICKDTEVFTFPDDGYGMMDAINSCSGFTSSGEADAVVDVRSQKGGLSGSYVSGIGNQRHDGSVSNIQVMNKLVFLLKESPKSTYFTTGGFAPADADFKFAEVTTRSATQLLFDPTLKGKTVSAGETLPIHITKDAALGKVVFISTSEVSDSITLGYTSNANPTFNYKIRNDFAQAKTIKLLAIAKLGTEYVTDSTYLTVAAGNCPDVITIVGTTAVCADGIYTYTISPTPINPTLYDFQWAIMSGIILSGNGTPKIRVRWSPLAALPTSLTVNRTLK